MLLHPKRPRYSLYPALLLPVSLSPQSSKTSKVNFGHLVASSALWLKENFIVRMTSKYHTVTEHILYCRKLSGQPQLCSNLCHLGRDITFSFWGNNYGVLVIGMPQLSYWLVNWTTRVPKVTWCWEPYLIESWKQNEVVLTLEMGQKFKLKTWLRRALE